MKKVTFRENWKQTLAVLALFGVGVLVWGLLLTLIFQLAKQSGFAPGAIVLASIAAVGLTVVMRKFLAAFIVVLLVIPLSIARDLEHRILLRYGIITTSVVTVSYTCDDEDGGLCGSYVYKDRHGKEHQGRFSAGGHFPGPAYSVAVDQACHVGATNPVRYWPLFPAIHEVDFPFRNMPPNI